MTYASNIDNLVLEEKIGKIAILTLNHPNKHNPISQALNEAICTALEHTDQDPAVDAIVLTGGKDRSFCAGGDFKETSLLREQKDVEFWLDSIIRLYQCVLSASKPVICALDGHAIGMGFQLALCADWRVATPNSSLAMVELEKGIACVLGSAMLQHCYGRILMSDIVYGCAPIAGSKAHALGLVNDVAEPEALLAAAVLVAERFAAYPSIPFSTTKSFINGGMIEVIRNAMITARTAHAKSFAGGTADEHFRNILGATKYHAPD